MSQIRTTLHARVSAAILEAAAAVLADRGEQASMADVAAAAGMARATVYRYFPNREALLEALGRLAVEDAGERLRAGRLQEVPVPDAFERAVRARAVRAVHRHPPAPTGRAGAVLRRDARGLARFVAHGVTDRDRGERA